MLLARLATKHLRGYDILQKNIDFWYARQLNPGSRMGEKHAPE
jgi:hypothetical protein